MANSSTHQARAASRRKVAPPAAPPAGSPRELQRAVWDAVLAAVEIVRDPNAAADLRLRAVHAVSQTAATYTKVFEAVELDARLRAVEEDQAQRVAF